METFPGQTTPLFVKSLQDKDFRQQQIIQNLAAALYTCDALGYVKFYNKAAVELWGREPEIGKDLWCGSWKIYRLDGTLMPFDELKELAIRQSEEKFKQIAGELEIRVNERTKELLSANVERKQINEELEEFAFIASHDMQEPLREIKFADNGIGLTRPFLKIFSGSSND